MEMRVTYRQRQAMEIDEEILWRRARVLVYRMRMEGDLLHLYGSDEVTPYVLELLSREHPLRVDSGMASGYHVL
jgi:hypothetical protein